MLRNAMVRLSDDVITQEVQGETVIMDLQSDQYFTLDTTGTRIWQLLQESGSVEAAFNVLLEEYEVEEGTLAHDIEELLGALIEEGLVSVVDQL
jgi:hypothetical protein